MGRRFCPVWGDGEDEKTISTQGVALGSVIADLSGRNTSPRYRYRHRPRHRHSQKNPQQKTILLGILLCRVSFPANQAGKGITIGH